MMILKFPKKVNIYYLSNLKSQLQVKSKKKPQASPTLKKADEKFVT